MRYSRFQVRIAGLDELRVSLVDADLPLIAGPVLDGRYDFVIGSRIRGNREPRSLHPSQIFAGWLAGVFIRLRYGIRYTYTDMGPFRAISRSALAKLQMSEMTCGWNLEMQMKAARNGLRILEVPVSYRLRQGGVSKSPAQFRDHSKPPSELSVSSLPSALDVPDNRMRRVK